MSRPPEISRLAPLEPGRRVGRYRVRHVLGEGGIAVVYRVEHLQLNSEHALKVVAVPSRSLLERLLDEGRAQARVRHRNVVSVIDVIEVDGCPGLVMELVEGPTLEALIYDVWLDLPTIDGIGRALLRGIEAAHGVSVVHRDLKPANILVTEEDGELVPKITDFGLAKDLQSEVSRTHTGAFMGTPNYMAPEQVRDARGVDGRADLWAVGAVLYELIARRRAFEAPDMLQIFNRVAAGERPSLEEERPDVPERMVRAIEAALTVDRDARVATAQELLQIWAGDVPEADARPILDRLVPSHEQRVRAVLARARPPASTGASETVPIPVAQVPTQVQPWSPRTRRIAWAAGLALGGALLVGSAVALTPRPPPPPPEPVHHPPAPMATAPGEGEEPDIPEVDPDTPTPETPAPVPTTVETIRITPPTER